MKEKVKRLLTLVMALALIVTTVWSLPVHAEESDTSDNLMDVAIYNSRVASVDSLCEEFTVTDQENQFYVIASNGWNIKGIELAPELDDIADYSINAEEGLAVVTVTGTPRDGQYYSLNVTIANSEGWESPQFLSVKLRDGRAALKYHSGRFENNSFVEMTDWGYMDRIEVGLKNTNDLFFYYISGGDRIPLHADQIRSSKPSVLQLSQSDLHPDAVHIEGVGLGSATVDYSVDGVTYSMEVQVTLPEIALYTSTTPSESTYVSQYIITDTTSDTLYLVGRNGWKITSAELENDFSDVAELTLNEAGYATIRISDQVQSRWYGIRYDAVNEKDSNWKMEGCGLSLEVKNLRPGLRFHWGYHQGDGLIESESSEYDSSWITAPGNSSELFFYYWDGVDYQRVPAKNLKSSNTSVVTLSECDSNQNAVRLEVVGFGTAAIEYDINGKTYQVMVYSKIPEFGFYTAPEVSAENYITEFKLKDNQDSFYLVGTDDWVLTSVEVTDAFADYAEVVLDETGAFAKITVKDMPENDYWLNIVFRGKKGSDDMDSQERWQGIVVRDMRSGLKFRWGTWDDESNQMVEDTHGGLSNKWTGSPGRGSELFFYYLDGDKQIPVNADNLKSSDPSVVTISQDEMNPRVTRLELVDFGSAYIEYEVNNKTYQVEIKSTLPEVGFYSKPVASEENYVSEYVVSSTENTIYLMGSDGWKITSVRLNEDFMDVVSGPVEIDENGVVKLQITGDFYDGRYYDLEFDAERPETHDYTWGYANICLRDRRPGLLFCWGTWDENKQFVEDLEGESQRNWFTGPNNCCDVFVYYVDGNEMIPLTADDLVSLDESILTVSESPWNRNAVRVQTVDFGCTGIGYNYNGKTYVIDVIVELPEAGFYVTPKANQQDYLENFIVTDNDRVFYLAVKNGFEITSFEPSKDFEDIATFAMDPSRKFVTITVTGTPEDGRYYDVRVEGRSADSDDRWFDFNTGIQLINGNPMYYDYSDRECIISEEIGIDSQIVYRDTNLQDVTAAVTDVRVTGGDEDAVEIEKRTEKGNDSWVITAKKCGTAEITITHEDAGNPEKTMEYTFKITVLDKIFWIHQITLSRTNWETVPGDLVANKYVAHLDYYDYESEMIQSEDVTDQVKFDWSILGSEVSENTRITFNKNTVSIKVADDEMPGSYLDYECKITYSDNGEDFEAWIGGGIFVTDSYYYAVGSDLPENFGFEDVAPLNVVVKKVTYDYETRTKTDEAVNDGLYLEWNRNFEEIQILCNGKEVEYGERIPFDPNDKYSVKRGAIFENHQYAFDVSVSCDGEYGEEYISYYSWGLNAAECPHPADEIVIDNYEEATCTEDGFSGDKWCAVCGEVIEEGKVIEKLGHKTELQGAKAATCTEEGYTGDEVCTVCEEIIKKGEAIEKVAHKTELKGAKDATCTEEGYTGDEVCTVCEEIIKKGEAIEKVAHKTELKGVKDATCTEDGYTGDEVCTVCKEIIKKGEAIEKLGHKTELKGVKAATCTEEGYTGDEVCTVCKEIVKKGEVIQKFGHKTQLKGVREASHTATGYTGDEVCVVCNQTVVQGKVIAAIGHSHTSTIKPATCTEAGQKVYTCSCGDTYTEVLAPVGHIYQNGVCTVCQAKDPNYKPETSVAPVVKEEVKEAAKEVTNDIVNTLSSSIAEAKKEAAASGETLSTDKLVETVKEVLADSKDKEVKAVVSAVSDETLEKVIVAIEEDKSISIEVKAQPVSVEEMKVLAGEDVKKIEKLAGNDGTVAQYLDLSVLIQATDGDGNVETLGTVNEPTKAFKFTLSVPENLQKEGRRFYVIRVHDNGVAEIISVTDHQDGTISFEANKFSTYALAYTDEQPQQTTQQTTQKPVSPQTGDNNAVLVWAMIVACGAIAGCISASRRRRFQ